MTPEDIAAMEAHDAEVDKAFRKLERQRADLTAKNIQLRADIAKLTAERDAARAEIVALCEERLQLKAELDETRAGELAAARNEPGHALPEDRDHAIVAYFRLFLQWRHQRERADQAEAAIDRVRSDALADAIEAVCGLQIRDASRLAEHHGHGDWCRGGTAPGMCHVAEAHATANRVLDALRALDGSGT